jgi:glutaminyl-peptide cyclotransferase
LAINRSSRRAVSAGIVVCLSFLGTLKLPSAARAATTAEFSGARAFAYLRQIVAFGPRPAGSKALQECRRWIVRQLTLDGCHAQLDNYVASTPMGDIKEANIMVKLPGASPDVIMLTGHYDTKLFTQFRFVGANDGGSSTAFLMEMARVLAHQRHKYTYWLVFYDGEEAVRHWSATDSTYGSRHLVQKLEADGELSRIQAMILVDMIGDKNLDIRRDSNSTPWLNRLLFRTAARLGYSKNFLSNPPLAMEDDHNAFIAAGVSAVDIIDFDYGPNNSYWHTAQDTIDKCSPESLQIVGRVVEALLDELDHSPQVH